MSPAMSPLTRPSTSSASQGRPSAAARSKGQGGLQKGNFIGIKTGLASALSAPKLRLKGQCSFLKVSQALQNRDLRRYFIYLMLFITKYNLHVGSFLLIF